MPAGYFKVRGHLGGSVREGSGHDLTVPGFEPRMGLYAESLKSLLGILCLRLALRPAPAHVLSLILSKISKLFFFLIKIKAWRTGGAQISKFLNPGRRWGAWVAQSVNPLRS